MIASEVSAAEDDKLTSQSRQDQDLLQQALSELSVEADHPAALSVDDLPELADASLPLDEVPQYSADVPVADLDGMMLSAASPDVTTTPGVDGKTTMSDAGSGGGSAGSASSASTGAASGAAEAGAAAGGAGATAGVPGLGALGGISAGMVGGAIGFGAVAAAAAGGGGAGGGLAGSIASAINGLVVDGNVSGAKVYFDLNDDGIAQDSEYVATTGADGKYSAKVDAGSHKIIIKGGVDTLTGQTIGTMVTPAGYTNVSPLTTLLAASGISEADLKAKLGIDPSIDLNNYDPLADMKSGDPAKMEAAQKAFTVSQQVYAVLQTAANLQAQLGGGTDITSVAQTLANSIKNSTGGDSLSILQQAAQETVNAAAGSNTALANAVSAALSNVTGAIESSYAHLADALASGDNSQIANAVSVAAVSQSALVSSVTSAVAGDTSTLSLLSDSTSLANLANLYESGIASNLQGGGTTKVEVTVPTTYTVAAALAATLPTNYTIVDTVANITAELNAHPTGTLLSGALGVVATSGSPISLATAQALINGVASISFQQQNLVAAGAQSLTLANAQKLADKFLKFNVADTAISVSFTQAELSTVVDYALKFGNLGVDVLNPGASLTVTADQATAIVTTGHMVFAGGADVTLSLTQSEVATALATSSGAQALHDAGIDHLAASSGSLTLTVAQANNLVAAGLDLPAVQHSAVLTANTNTISDSALHSFGLAHIDTITASTTAPALATTDHFASQMVVEGLHFATGADVSLGLSASHPADGTHLSTSLKDLQKLGVDQVGFAAGTGEVFVDLGSGSWGTGTLPHFAAGDTVDLLFNNSQLQEVVDHKLDLITAGIDELHTTDSLGQVTLSVTQADALLGNDGIFNATTDLGFNQLNDVTLAVANDSNSISHVAQEAAALKTLGVDHIDVADTHATVHITDAQATGLVAGGLEFSTDDHIDLTAASGTHLHTSLQQLQHLGVDSITVAGGGDITIDLGNSAQIDFAHLPTFNANDHVTLSFNDANGQDVMDHLAELQAVHVDTLSLAGGTVQVTLDEADQIFSNHLQFSTANDVTLEVQGDSSQTTNEVLADIIPDFTNLQQFGTDHLRALAPVEINESAARVLVHAGIDFTTDSNVTMNVHTDMPGVGTHLSSTLKDLQNLHVDTVIATGASELMVDLGPGNWDGADALPTFADPLHVTLNVGAGQIGQVATPSHYGALVSHGIDSIQVHGTYDQLSTLNPQDVVAAHVSGLTLDMTEDDFSDMSSLPNMPAVAGVHVDKIDVAGMAGHASELHVSAQVAHDMINAGLSFEAADHITLDINAGATGTHFATSADALHKLGVDHVDVHVANAAFDFHSLPGFDSSLDVTLDLSEVNHSNLPTMDAAAGALLESLGIDNIQVNADINSLSAQLVGDVNNYTDGSLDVIHRVMGLDLAIDLHGSTNINAPANLDTAMQSLYHDLTDELLTNNYNDLISALSDSGIADMNVEQGDVKVSDSLLSALAESGMLHAVASSNIVVDATASGNHMFTSLKDLADLDVDHVTANTGGNLYINLGDLGEVGALNEVKAILSHLDPNMFSGANTPTLVLDVRTATGLLDNTGHFDATVMAGLETIGIKEVAVLVGHNETTSIVAQAQSVTAPEVKLIGQDADPTLYDDLHHPRQ